MSTFKDACVMTSPLPELATKVSTGKPKTKALKFPPCFVCGSNASGLHYGINSCEACKGFFRRYLIRNEEYKCTKGGNCEITSRHRGNCSGCRLTKCLALGMSKTASRLGRYTLSRRTETIVKVKELEKGKGDKLNQPGQQIGKKGSNPSAVVKGNNSIINISEEGEMFEMPSSNESGYNSDNPASAKRINLGLTGSPDGVKSGASGWVQLHEKGHNFVNPVAEKKIPNSVEDDRNYFVNSTIDNGNNVGHSAAYEESSLINLLVKKRNDIRHPSSTVENITQAVTNSTYSCECPQTYDDDLCRGTELNTMNDLDSPELMSDPFPCDLFLDSPFLFRHDQLNNNDVSSKLFVTKVTSLENPRNESFKEHNMLENLLKYMDNIRPHGEHFTDEEKVEKMMKHHEKYHLNTEIFGTLKAVPDEEYYSFLRNYGIDLDGRWDVLKQSKYELEDIVERYVQFAKQVPGFASLSVNDQSNLLKVSRSDFFLILMHRGYLPDKQIFLAHNGQAYHLEEAADKFFSRNLFKTILKQYHQWQLLEINEEEMALLVSISITFSDRCKLEHPISVEQIQLHLMELLRNALERSCAATAQKRFCKIIDCFVQMRESSEMYFKEYKKLCSNDMIIEEVPMMMEFLLEDY